MDETLSRLRRAMPESEFRKGGTRYDPRDGCERRQTEIFTATDYAQAQEEFWCYVVQHRVARVEGGWEPWESDTKPAHFRREADAIERCEARTKELGCHVLEFRVAPKWLGYIPDADEVWIH